LTAEALRLSPTRRELLCFDAADFRSARNKRLRCEAMIAGNLVLSTGQSYVFPPMNGRDRGMLLSELRTMGMTANSAGSGLRRHVVLEPLAEGRAFSFENPRLDLAPKPDQVAEPVSRFH
jgi:predicted RNA-binding protein Jag